MANDNVFAVLSLSGGNDGLNTVVPFTNGLYYDNRPRLGISPEDVVQITDEYGFYPKMAPLKKYWDEGKMAILDVEPQALKILRSAEYAPYVVFIAAPCLTSVQDYDGSLEKLARESDALKNTYGHFFGWFAFVMVSVEYCFQAGFNAASLSAIIHAFTTDYHSLDFLFEF